MNLRVMCGLSLVCGLIVAAVPLAAHHSFAAEFDSTKPLTVTGTVVRLEWTNPHARLVIEAKDDSGKPVTWDFELGPPNGLMRQGWRRDSLKQGHLVTVNGFHSKTQPHIANARSVKLADGRQVFAGSSFDTGSGN
ncbi:MAG TPA: DUF6152 family protein [Vicinamibacterales bacterium]|nr:DUF6152 family protein [Vicinamibacterales bacterium]